jgi:tetracycline repressor-like protein
VQRPNCLVVGMTERGPREALAALQAGDIPAARAHLEAAAQTAQQIGWEHAIVQTNLSEQLQALGVPQQALSDSAGVLVNYILGVAGQNAANARALASSKLDRSAFLAHVAAQWAQLDPARYPSAHKARTQLREHDDREQFLTGIDLILAGIETVNRAGQDSSAR